MSSRHEGVSCDDCMALNFTGDRYKCLRCYDFDLCSRCYNDDRAGRTKRTTEPNSGHQQNHPMQCIMTQQDFERTYRNDPGHSWERSRVVIFTCPVCGAQGFSRERLVSHVLEEHPSTSATPSSHSKREEMACPICISSDSYRIGFADCVPNQLTDMAAHMTEYHSHAAATPSSGVGQGGQSANAGFTEYLRDDDIRRVILSNIPLMGDVEFDDSLSESARRHVNVLLNTNRAAASVLYHSRRRVERSNESAGHEDEGSSQPTTAAARPVPHGMRNITFGRHWQPISGSHRGGSNVFSNSLPFRLRPIRPNEGESARTVNPTSQSSSVFRSIVHRDSNLARGGSISTRGGTSSGSRTTQSVGSLIRSSRRFPQNASSDRGANEAVSHQQPSRIGVRSTESDRNNSSKYRRGVMRSVLENTCKNEQQALSRRKVVKAPFSTTETEGSHSSKSERNVQRNEQQCVSVSFGSTLKASDGFLRSDNSLSDETALRQPLFVEKDGKAALVLPEPTVQAKSPGTADVPKKLVRHKKSPKNDSVKRKDTKLCSDERSLKKDREKRQGNIDNRLNWLQFYQPLFVSSASLAYSLPVLHLIEDDNCTNVWGSPKVIPEIELSSSTNPEANDESSIDDEDNEVPPLTLTLSVGRPIGCTYIPPASKSSISTTVSELNKKGRSQISSFRRTLEAIKSIEEKRRTNPGQKLILPSKKTSRNAKINEDKSPRQKAVSTSSATKSQGSYNVVRVEELSRIESIDGLQNAFKEPVDDLLLGAPIVEKRSRFNPYHVVPEEFSNEVVSSWLDQERNQDGHVAGLGFQLDNTIKHLMSQISDFSDDDSEEESSANLSDDEPMFDPCDGTDDELLAKKCTSCGILQTPSPYFAVGPVNAALNEKENSDNDYWKSYRFLHNRRDVFLLRKDIESPLESTFVSPDWRFARQLLLGTCDSPASRFLRCHYLTNGFNILLECNLRNLIRCENEQELAKPNVSEAVTVDEETLEKTGTNYDASAETISAGAFSDMRQITVHPALWHFLDLGGFLVD